MTVKNSTYTIKHWDALSTYELYEILHLRGKVFVVGQQCTCIDPDGKDPEAFHLTVKNSTTLIGYARLFPPGKYYDGAASIGRVAVLREWRNQGIGKEIMKRGIAFLKANFPENPIIISAQSYLEEFYKNLGFVTVSDEYLEENMPHVRMKLS